MPNLDPISRVSIRLAREAQWRYWVRHPGQFMLTLLIIAVGVASAVGMDIAIEASKKSFLLSLAATNGRATHRIEGNGGVPDKLFTELRAKEGFSEASPVVAGRLRLKIGPNGESVQLLGLDPLIDTVHLGANVVGSLTPTTSGNSTQAPVEALMEPDSVAMSTSLAARLHLVRGQRVPCLGGQSIVIATLFESSGAGLEDILICDIATAQELLGLQGKLTYIALRAPDNDPLFEQRLAKALPPEYHVTSVGQRSYASLQLANSLFLNLRALSWMAALVGVFLIYQAQSFCLLATRPQLAQMRRLGLTPQEAGWIVFQDGLALGWLGSLLGCLAGVGVSHFLIKMLSATLDDLYFAMQVQEVFISPWSLAKGLLVGLGTACLAVLPHAISVFLEPPALLGMRSRMEGQTQIALRRFFWLGLALALLGGLSLSQDFSLSVQLVALAALVTGMAALIPHSVAVLNTALTSLLSKRAPLWLSLGLRQVQSNMTRTGVAVAALSMALACVVSIETTVGSFRETLNEWLEQTLQSDIYMTLADRDALREGSYLPHAMLAELRAKGLVIAEGGAPSRGEWAGVSALVIRHQLVNFQLSGDPNAAPQLLVALETADRQLDTYRLVTQDADPRQHLREGQAWISQPFARRHHLKIGDILHLPTPSGVQALPVAAIFVDFSTDQGYVLVSYALYERWFRDQEITGITLRIPEGGDIDTALRQLRDAPGSEVLDIRSNRSLKALSRVIFERTFQVTKALRWFALVIAVVGMSSSLTVLALQKRKERALLRALGMTDQEVLRVHLVHRLMLGFWAGLFAIAAGLAQAYVMVKVIQGTAFGWTLAFHVPGVAWASPWAAALVCCLASLFSLWGERRGQIIHILSEE
jgi:putative ABC transport system permease protein